MSKVKVLGYSERGVINSIVFFLKEQPQHIHGFIKILGIENDFFDDDCEYTFLNEQSFSKYFGSNDWTIIAKKNEEIRVIFIEAKVGAKYDIEKEFGKIERDKRGIDYKTLSSNIFAQLYYKFLLVELKEHESIKSEIGREMKKLGNHPVVIKAFNDYIKPSSKFYYVAILPKKVKDFSEKFGELGLEMPKDDVKSVNWGKIEQFFTQIKAASVIENFSYNKGQIF